jgi:hypothetical protein
MVTIEILSACARPHVAPERDQRLESLAGRLPSWSDFAAEAERHGMGPLAYRHLRTAGASVPPEVTTALAGSYLRHRHDNAVRSQVLAELVAALNVSDIPVLIVKGGALAHMLYPDPALRPMSDLDLLVDRAHLDRAGSLLQELGMSAPVSDSGQGGKGLTTAGRVVEGAWVGIELHTDLFEEGYPASLTLRTLSSEPLAFRIGGDGPAAHTLGIEELLWHLCEHLRFHTTVFLPWRMIWMADIVGIAEGQAGPIDWGRVRSRYPEVLRMLSLVDCLCPLSSDTLDQAGLIRTRVPGGVGEDFDGWPRRSVADQHDKGLGRTVWDTLSPSEWWLRLHYGLGTDASAWRQRWISHPLDISRHAANMLARRR